jgi:hypothetical protein
MVSDTAALAEVGLVAWALLGGMLLQLAQRSRRRKSVCGFIFWEVFGRFFSKRESAAQDMESQINLDFFIKHLSLKSIIDKYALRLNFPHYGEDAG